MSYLTDAPAPHGVTRKPPIGGSFGSDLGSVTGLPEAETAKAIRVIAGRAVNAADARRLLEAVGLLDATAPRTNPKKGMKP